MSAADASSAHGRPRAKTDEDDHDLLTFSEVGERLRLEIAAAAVHLDRLEQTGTPADIADARSRLDTLRTAAQRNAAHPINDANFEKFFGYPGKAKRNLPGCTGK